MSGYVIGKMLLKIFIGAPVVHDSLTPRMETLRRISKRVLRSLLATTLENPLADDSVDPHVWSTSSSVVLQNMAIISTGKVRVLNIKQLQITEFFSYYCCYYNYYYYYYYYYHSLMVTFALWLNLLSLLFITAGLPKGMNRLLVMSWEPTPSKVLKIAHTRFLFMVIIVDVRVCVSSIDQK